MLRQQLSAPVGPQSDRPAPPPAQLGGGAVHLPAEHMLPAAQLVPLTHVPAASQVCGMVPLHFLLPGTHDPRHAVAAQMYGHVVSSTQAPEASHT